MESVHVFGFGVMSTWDFASESFGVKNSMNFGFSVWVIGGFFVRRPQIFATPSERRHAYLFNQ